MLVMVALLALPAPSAALSTPHLHFISAIGKALKLAPSVRSSVSALVASQFDSAGSSRPEEICAVWVELRAKAIAPVLRAAMVLCLAMTVVLMMEAVFMSAVSLGVKLLRRTPEKRYRWEPIAKNDEEMSSAAFPMVLVQIPMFNEKEVVGFVLNLLGTCQILISRSDVEGVQDVNRSSLCPNVATR